MVDFQTGDAAGMNAASAVIIIRVVCGKCGTVCVSGNQDLDFLLFPVMQTLFRLMLSRIVFCGACRVENAVTLKRFPKVSD